VEIKKGLFLQAFVMAGVASVDAVWKLIE